MSVGRFAAGQRSRAELDCAVDQLHRLLVMPALIGQCAEKLQRIGMVGLATQDLPIRLLRLDQTPRSMVLESHIQKIFR